MATGARIAIVGVGYSVPDEIRGNDDPIFHWLHQHHPSGQDLFQGYQYRRVLPPEKGLMSLMLPAAQRAISDAGLQPSAIDLVLGDASVSTYVTPNTLAQVHAKLGLPTSTGVIPLNSEFTNFNDAVVLATAMIETGRASNVLVVCGGNWTRYVDYHTPQAISASDGAGAAVIGWTSDSSKFALVDSAAAVASNYYGSMYMEGDKCTVRWPTPDYPDEGELYTRSYFHLTEAGQEAYKEFGIPVPGQITNQVLERNKLTGSDIALVSHQSSSVLMNAWEAAIKPAQYLTTLEDFANMTLATIPVNLAYCYEQIKMNHLVLLGVGNQVQASAVLLARHPS
jgi:3-oxoacyl-[acyl-carrier-protein] synthase-3